uniref:Nebulette n=9 Tax=Australaves TaxID=3073809 RepID=A0A674GHZ9_TAEGU
MTAQSLLRGASFAIPAATRLPRGTAGETRRDSAPARLQRRARKLIGTQGWGKAQAFRTRGWLRGLRLQRAGGRGRQVPRGARPGLGPHFGELPSYPRGPGSTVVAPRSRSPSPSPPPSLSLGPAPPRRVPSRCARRRTGTPPAAISPRSGRLRRGARPPLLPSPRCGPRRWAWLGLRLQRGARRESRSPRRGEPSAQAHGGGGGGGRRAAGAAAPAPRPPTRTCCRAAVSWSAASSTAAADDLLARPQPLRTPGVPASAGDGRSASGGPVQRSPPHRNLGHRRPPEPPPQRSRKMNPQCARCGKVVYPTEKVNCLDKYWHKGCFHCEVCKMALNMNNYKGYEKKPYCNAHYPKQSFTTVADTPENLRLKQQSELQSQVKYKRDFEESKGRGFSIVTDTPELQRLKRTQEQISNVKYHEDFEKTKGRGFTPVVDDPITERVRKNTQIVSDAAYKGVHPHIVEMDRRPGIIVAPVLPGAYQQSQTQGYGYMHQTSMSSMRSMHSQPHSASLRTYRAMYDYSAQDEDEVSFRDGDYIINVQPIDDGWMYGTVQRTGKTGMLPANYIEFVN